MASRTLAEQEVTFRYDQEERVLWAGTTTPRVMLKWKRAKFPVSTIGVGPGKVPMSWEVKIPSETPGFRAVWRKIWVLSLPPRVTKKASGEKATGKTD